MTRKRSLPLSRVYRLLETGPVVLLTTARRGRPNVMPMSWHTMIDFEPPLVGCVVSDRSFTFENLVATRECAINVPTVELAPAVVGCGNVSGRRVDKLARFGLTPVPASRIAAPLVAECHANLECKVIDTRMVKRYDLFVLEVLAAWIDPSRKRPETLHHRGGGLFVVAGREIRLASGKP
jgi:flavin reductase (DIM6/NTAB) family NADH-FMN oxidoreductase RutF